MARRRASGLFSREQPCFGERRVGRQLVCAMEREGLVNQMRQKLREKDGRGGRLPEEEAERARTRVHLVEPDLSGALVREKVDPRRAGTADRLEAFGGPIAQTG